MKYSESGDTNEPQDIAEDIESAVNVKKQETLQLVPKILSHYS